MGENEPKRCSADWRLSVDLPKRDEFVHYPVDEDG